MNRTGIYPALIVTACFAGCASNPVSIAGEQSQLELRQAQTRQYDTLDRKLTLRSVVATLQDLGFVIDEADDDLGTVTATRLHRYRMRMTVTVVARDNETVSVRANARMGENGVTDPRTYQDFFSVLDKAMFLTLNNVD